MAIANNIKLWLFRRGLINLYFPGPPDEEFGWILRKLDDSNVSLICSTNRKKVEKFIDEGLNSIQLEVKSVSINMLREHLETKCDSQGFRRPKLEML